MRFIPSLAALGSPQRAWLWQAGIYLSFWVELRLFTDLRVHYGLLRNPVLFVASSVLLCVFALLYWRDRPVAVPGSLAQTSWRLPVALVGLLLGSVAVLYGQAPVIASHPIDVHYSDIIPSLQVYVARFRSGELVYKQFTTLPYPLFPTYLPLQWLPYVPADQLGIDYRWWALGLLLLVGFGVYQFELARQPLGWLNFLLKVALPTYVLYRLVTTDPELYAHTMEMTIIAYYCVLMVSIMSRSALFQALGLVLCLLSRYSLIFWVPFYLWVLWREVSPRHALLVAGLVLAGVAAIYIVPFLSKDWTIFTHGLNEYRIAALGEWSRSDGSNGRPPQLFSGLGLASWFYTFAPGNLGARLSVVQLVHAGASVGAIGVAAAGYYWFGRRYDYRVFSLIALKFSLTVFYAFLQVPYAYLTSLGLFISVFVVLITGTGQRLIQKEERAPEVTT